MFYDTRLCNLQARDFFEAIKRSNWQLEIELNLVASTVLFCASIELFCECRTL